MRRARTAILLLAAVGASAGCGERLDVVARALQDAQGGVDGSVDGGADSSVDGGAEASCPHAQTSVTVAGARDLEALAAEVTSRALCTCSDYSGAARLQVTSGEAAVDGALSLNSDAAFGGALRVAGAAGVSLGAGLLTVDGDLSVATSLRSNGALVRVGGDAALGGTVQLQELTVQGSLSLEPGASYQVDSGAREQDALRETVQVDPVCGCDDESRLDAGVLTGLVEPADDLSGLSQPCAALLATAGQLPETLEARAGLLVVEGDLRSSSALHVEVAAGETLDVVVLGNVSVDGALTLGSATGGQVRMFVLGRGTIQLEQRAVVYGLLHAPDAELVVPQGLEVRGGVVAQRVAAAAPVTLSTFD